MIKYKYQLKSQDLKRMIDWYYKGNKLKMMKVDFYQKIIYYAKYVYYI